MNGKELKVIGKLCCPYLAAGWVEFSSLPAEKWERKLKSIGATQEQIDDMYINNADSLKKERARKK